MPLLVLSATDAVANRKSNRVANWGSRSVPNRVEPVARPEFKVPFRLDPGEAIFTVGSCFARNVETELLKRGFRIPMRELFKRPEFQKVELSVINNFGTPSIYNEFAWALGERPFVPEQHILPVMDGKFADVHLTPTMRPDSWEVALHRRLAITEATRTVTQCRVVIMTLGLVELWFDAATGYYLNSAPRPSFLKQHPERFELHVLSFDEAYRFLEDALLLIKRHGRPDLQVLLTVSPVPMSLTHRDEDVVVANMYSKSMLRTVAETIVARHDFVTYFPSYESVVLSDRKLAWLEDMVHVTDQIVALNVGRMIDAFVGGELDRDALKTAVAAGGLPTAIEYAGKVKGLSRDTASWFFAEHAGLSRGSTEFALAHGQFLLDAARPAEALEVIRGAPGAGVAEPLVLLEANALVALDRPRDAMAALELVSHKTMSMAVWTALIRAAFATDDPDAVVAVIARWRTINPGRSIRGLVLAGQWFHKRGDVERSLSFLRTALALNTDDQSARLNTAEVLISAGRSAEARAMLDGCEPVTATDIKLAERLRILLA